MSIIDSFAQNVVLAPYTTFKIGGKADLLIEAHDTATLVEAVKYARNAQIPYFLMGCGANILIGDGGFRGLVIANRANRLEVDIKTQRLFAESGAIIYPELIEKAVSNGLSGLEHYVMIPSTVGGALWQNLHFLSPDRSRTMFIEEVLCTAQLLTEQNEIIEVDKEWFNFGYDYSTLHDTKDIVLSATFQLSQAPETEMRETMAANIQWRTERHPPLATEPSAGSIFKKIEGIGAGRLIDQCGLKGYQIGGAKITHRHANIIINTGNATAKDVRSLIDFVVETVEKETGYRLETEIGMIGEFA